MIDRQFAAFARLSDHGTDARPMFAAFSYLSGHPATPADPCADLIKDPADGLQMLEASAAGVTPDVAATLPVMTWEQAKNVATHAFYSGASLKVTALVFAKKGADRMLDYCETQSAFAMPGSPAAEKIGTPEFDQIGAEDLFPKDAQ